MTWPAPDLRIDYQNVTVSADTHPLAHNDTNLTLNDDYRPEINRIGGQLEDGYLFHQRQDFSGSASFTKAGWPKLRALRVHLVGGGGGAGGAGATGAGEASLTAGGGAGGYAMSFITDIAGLALVETITIGSGGVSGTAGGAGGDGGTTTCFNFTASGGEGSRGQVSGAAQNYLVNLGAAGGGGFTGFSDYQQSGERAQHVAGQLLRIAGGVGASSQYGRGGFGANAVTATGGSGGAGQRGAGGGGAANQPNQNARNGGPGGDGYVVLELFY